MHVAESATMGAISELANSVGVSEITLMSAFGLYLAHLNQGGLSSVKLNRPLAVTTKKAKGGYGKTPMIGEEEFRINGAYMGKRDGVIIAAHLKGSKDSFEFPASLAEEVLDGYNELAENFVMTYGMDEDVADMSAAAIQGAEIENRKHREAMLETHMADERFGSW